MMVPALKGVGEAHRLRSATDIVTNLGLLAQQNSLAKNAMTALIIPGNDAPVDKRFRSVALFEITPRADGTPPSKGDWKQLTPWKQLPDGILINSSKSTFFSHPPPNFSPGLPVTVNVIGTSASSFGALVFLPNGRLINSISPTLHLNPGILVGESVMDTNQGANFTVITFIASTGKFKVVQP